MNDVLTDPGPDIVQSVFTHVPRGGHSDSTSVSVTYVRLYLLSENLWFAIRTYYNSLRSSIHLHPVLTREDSVQRMNGLSRLGKNHRRKNINNLGYLGTSEHSLFPY